MVLQASRWDALKDMGGVLTGFAEHVADRTDAHLILAGPQTSGVADDPEADEVFDDCISLWRALPSDVQRRIHLACVPMDDTDENAAIINALQRHATVVVQKSLAEGFGLTVAEAMWKSRPVVASAVGGIVDQVVPGGPACSSMTPMTLRRSVNAVESLLRGPERRPIAWSTPPASSPSRNSWATVTLRQYAQPV